MVVPRSVPPCLGLITLGRGCLLGLTGTLRTLAWYRRAVLCAKRYLLVCLGGWLCVWDSPAGWPGTNSGACALNLGWAAEEPAVDVSPLLLPAAVFLVRLPENAGLRGPLPLPPLIASLVDVHVPQDCARPEG
jgi:hypothetical protein